MRGFALPSPFLAVLLAACASAGGATSGSRDVLAASEIASANVTTAYEAVRQLRPEFLRSRGVQSIRSGTPEQPVVYVNGIRAGGLEALQRIMAMDVQLVRHVDARDATTRYGTGHAGGVIEITTK